MHDEIMVVENFLSEEECNTQIQTMERLISNGLHTTFPSSLERQDQSVSVNITAAGGQEGISDINDRIINVALKQYQDMFPILKRDILGIQEMKVQKTLAGGGFHNWHFEHDGGYNQNRVLAWTIYLNDDFDAGETEFMYQHMRLKPKTGMFAMFPCTFLHTHRGNPPYGGNKYILTGWIVDLDPYLARYKFKDFM